MREKITEVYGQNSTTMGLLKNTIVDNAAHVETVENLKSKFSTVPTIAWKSRQKAADFPTLSTILRLLFLKIAL